jgi:glycosyltransferase involved in cell wall biosynthesis
MADRRVVLVHDWLTGQRGGEQVLESLCRLYPEADILTLVHVPGSTSAIIERHRIRRSLVQWLPAGARRYREYLPVFPFAIEQFDLDDADVVISSSHCAAKAVVATGRALHVCYCHSPMRYAWDQFDAYFGPARVGRAANAMLRPVVAGLARWDAATAHRVDQFVANSRHVAGRIGRYYNRDASVLYPPVNTQFYLPSNAPCDPSFLVVSALVPYKRVDVAIGAAARLGRALRIVGTGPDESRLRALAGPHVTFLGRVPDETLRELYQTTSALVLPGEEDFGIAPVEAMACGRPVVAFGRGGATETVVDGVTGILVDELGIDAFAEGLEAVGRVPADRDAIRTHALRFGLEAFEDGFRALMADAFAAHQRC